MTNNPKQPRGPGGKFVKAGDGNPITKFRKAPLIITDEIDDSNAKLHAALESADQNSEAWLAGIERELKKSMDEQVSRELDRAHRMNWIGITLAIALAAILIVAAVLWIKP